MSTGRKSPVDSSPVIWGHKRKRSRVEDSIVSHPSHDSIASTSGPHTRFDSNNTPNLPSKSGTPDLLPAQPSTLPADLPCTNEARSKSESERQHELNVECTDRKAVESREGSITKPAVDFCQEPGSQVPFQPEQPLSDPEPTTTSAFTSARTPDLRSEPLVSRNSDSTSLSSNPTKLGVPPANKATQAASWKLVKQVPAGAVQVAHKPCRVPASPTDASCTVEAPDATDTITVRTAPVLHSVPLLPLPPDWDEMPGQMPGHLPCQVPGHVLGQMPGNSPVTDCDSVEGSVQKGRGDPKPPPFKLLRRNVFVQRSHRTLDPDEVPVCDCVYKEGDPESACGADRCLNALLSTECTPGYCPVGDRCRNQAGEFLHEYCGEIVTGKEAYKRALKYKEEGEQNHYIMMLSGSEFVDATKKGAMARFLNHSCDPNCESRKWTVWGEIRVGVFATRPIRAGEELCWDYKFEWCGGEKVKCRCGSDSCQGYLGANSRAFREDTYLWEDDDERYEVENIPTYDSDEEGRGGHRGGGGRGQVALVQCFLPGNPWLCLWGCQVVVGSTREWWRKHLTSAP